MVLRYVLDRRSGNQRLAKILEIKPKPLATIAIGAVGGLIVGLTSVGSGSLMIVLLLFLYPLIGANQLVGTDLTQAVPLTAAAALGALIFGHVEFGVTASIAIGSVPAVLIGSYLSSRAPDKFIRPIITFVIFASGLKYVGVGTTALGWILVIVVLGGGATWLFLARPWSTSESKQAAATATAGAAEARTATPRSRQPPTAINSGTGIHERNRVAGRLPKRKPPPTALSQRGSRRPTRLNALDRMPSGPRPELVSTSVPPPAGDLPSRPA